MERIATLRHKEVINIRDGFRLGYVCDILIDIKCGKVISFVVPGPCCLFGLFGKGKEYVIDWCCVVRIGEDIILIDADVRSLLRICEV